MAHKQDGDELPDASPAVFSFMSVDYFRPVSNRARSSHFAQESSPLINLMAEET